MKWPWLVLAILLLARPAFAWGREGHEIIGYLSEQQLTPQARSAVRRLLHGGHLSDSEVANWADDLIAHLPESARWHYVNIPESADAYVAARDCPDDDCVVARIEMYRRKLADPKVPPDARADALRFVIHLVADASQPLHCIDENNRGGNDVEVADPNHPGPLTLHQLWDSVLIDEDRGLRTIGMYRDQLNTDLTTTLVQKFQGGTVVDWVNECHSDGELVFDGLKLHGGRERVTLPADYVQNNSTMLEVALERAGSRVAKILNDTFAGEPVTPWTPEPGHHHRHHHHYHHYDNDW